MGAVQTFVNPRRKEIVAHLMALPLQTGDIFFRQSSTKGPFGIPFSTLVAKITKSEFSHGTVIYMREGSPYCLEVNDRGVVEYRLLDWLDFCVEGRFAVYRYKGMTPEIQNKVREAIEKFLLEDPLYDFTYSKPDKEYCTESVIDIYRYATGKELCKPMSISACIKKRWIYYAFAACNWLTIKLTGKGFDLTKEMYFVGNKEQGIMSSPFLECVVPSNPFTF